MADPTPEPQSASAIRLYTPRAPVYDSSHHPSFTARFISHISPHLSPGLKILDLACGTGLLTYQLAAAVGPSGRVVGVDVTPGMLAVAREKLAADKEKYPQVELFEHDVLDLDGIKELAGMKGGFDGITGASMFVLFQDPVAALGHWVRYLKPGGFVALDVTHPQNLAYSGTVEKTARRLGAFTLYHRMWVKGPKSLEEVMRKCGVEVQEMVVVENQCGQGDKKYKVEEADKLFEEGIDKEICKGFRESEEVRAEAKRVFKEEWEKQAVDGWVEEVDTVFLGIGKKVEETKPDSKALLTHSEIAFSGGCRCGSITYTSTTAPTAACCCYCAACRQLSGSGFIPWAQIPTSALIITTHPPESSSSQVPITLQTLNLHKAAERRFCNACGTPLFMVYKADPEETSVSMGSIDEASLRCKLPEIGSHIFLKEKANWVVLPNDWALHCEEFTGRSAEEVLGKSD
ncbi:S-adenosyl-L-methionine-dependent methyltransferase [Lophium mytilinum]|uniref:S-adenosyl-L-methionine-dependent methyltransferase n=1 Tax=Lophium mytilinum TaxID=390894 RepID=A0A6A6QDC8_9PEZI|nr:S-adenosyl-L-methionine-dependent methyltransferase [Lophium mytilinum]